MNREQKEELQKWHVSSSNQNYYQSHKLDELLPPYGKRFHEVMREDKVRAILFNRYDADVACQALATEAARVLEGTK